MDSLPQETIVGLENTLTVQNKSLQMEGIVDQSILSAGYIPSTNKLVPESMPIPLLNQKSDFDFRYEFSETRKVLDEFFNKAENEFPSETSNANSHIIKSNEAELMNLGSDRPNHVISEPWSLSRPNVHRDYFVHHNFDRNYIMSSRCLRYSNVFISCNRIQFHVLTFLTR